MEKLDDEFNRVTLTEFMRPTFPLYNLIHIASFAMDQSELRLRFILFLETVGFSGICMFLAAICQNTKIFDFVLGRDSHAESILQYDGREHQESCI